ncbi:type 1 glutamine amidotransferase [Pedobacter sp. SYP-B3415]|uniref:type 1 glutamine amidotransferase n=1 Tax=Pedobacter sp. SYP-B3415 TaxID=2496641 RepID=UPI00101C39D6|nr:GMP synthase [Pedobacter sp. SYP-B3415]
MSERQETAIRLAVIDLNNGAPNQGLRGIQDIVRTYRDAQRLDLQYRVFDLRQKNEVPDLSYDIYIASGGPGSPFDGVGTQWEEKLFNLIDEVVLFNLRHEQKKSMFFICHSFQLACRKFGAGEVTRRRSNAFGIFPVNMTAEGATESCFDGLDEPFFVADSRDWQVLGSAGHMAGRNMSILALEKERPHINLERCIMAMRFSPEIMGTQFHPEADPAGMKMYLLQDEKRSSVIAGHGPEKYEDMLSSLDDPAKLLRTRQTILPRFLDRAVAALRQTQLV